MTITASLPASIDLSHHVNNASMSRRRSPLKALYEASAIEGMCSLSGGLPTPKYFPFRDLRVGVYAPDADISPQAPAVTKLEHLDFDMNFPQGLELAKALQYSAASGLPALSQFAREWTQTVYKPATSDWQVLCNHGSTHGWSSIVRLLCEYGDYILTEQYTFPSSMGVWTPLGVKGAPVKMDQDGMRSDDLRRVLANWDTEHPGTRRPRLMYIVPVGSNPCGSTMPLYRRQEIYDICVEYDVIITEDDPYTYLQFPEYKLGELAGPTQIQSPEEFHASLVPSFLQLDYQGRVIRLETFSKTLAPGSRLGFSITNPIFTERLLRAAEVEVQAPNGWSQVIITGLMQTWGIRGYLTWLANLRDEYQLRRDEMCNALAKSFDLRPASTVAVKGVEPAALVGFLKGSDVPIFSFVPPTGGMFLWLRVEIGTAPGFMTFATDAGCQDPESEFTEELWARLAANKVLLAPGYFYEPFQGNDVRGGEAGIGHFRLAYSMSVKDEMEAAIERMAGVFRQTWGY